LNSGEYKKDYKKIQKSLIYVNHKLPLHICTQIQNNMILNSSGERDGHSEAEDVGSIGGVELPSDCGSDGWVQRADGKSHFVGGYVTDFGHLGVSRGGGDGPGQRDAANGAHNVGGASSDIFRSCDLKRDVRVGSFDKLAGKSGARDAIARHLQVRNESQTARASAWSESAFNGGEANGDQRRDEKHHRSHDNRAIAIQSSKG